MKIYLDSVGCRLNQSEIERFARQFRAAGHNLVAHASEADLVVVNTCTVTAVAASDSRQKIRQAARAGAPQIVATGCWATLNQQAAADLPHIIQVVPNLEKDQLVAELLKIPRDVFDLEPMQREPTPGAHFRTRAFIKVQDGCDNRCTFCITTVARGPGRSQPVSEIFADIRAALLGGVKEVVLTGVHLGSWGRDLYPTRNLKFLVQSILNETDVARLRLSSLEPWQVDVDLLGLWKNPRLCPHLHLPLQSGCAATLRRMARKITPQQYADLVSTARDLIPGVAITADMIVGFPGESEADFHESLAFVKAMLFAGGHVFTYSAREGTAAALLPNQIFPPVKKTRNARMREVFSFASEAYRRAFLGQRLEVLWESAKKKGANTWELQGLTPNYLRVSATAPQNLWNAITPVTLSGITENGMLGEPDLYDSIAKEDKHRTI